MKKRVLSFLLCVLMVLPLALTSCTLFGGDPDNTTTKPEEEDIYVKPATLNFHIIADQIPSADDQASVEAAFNKISKELYKTQVHFVYHTADKYKEELMATLAAAKEVGGQSASSKFENSEVVTSLNDVNIPIEIYPEIANNQVDIVLINSKELYSELRSERYLTEISGELNSNFTDIKQSVNSHLINGAMEGSSMYAVPNNILIGEYKLVLIHKEMAYLSSYLQREDFLTDKGTIDYSELRKFAATLQGFKNANDPVYDDIRQALGVDVIYPMEATFDYPTISYFPKATTPEGSTEPTYPNTLLGVIYPFNATKGSSITLTNIFENTDFINHHSLMIEASENGYCPTAASADSVAYGIRYTTSSFDQIGVLEKDYIVLEADAPRLNDEAAFNAMFAVTKYSASTERSLEIIQALVAGKDPEEVALRNILQYGVEGVHYTKDKDTNNVTYDASTTYMMNVNYTGNLVTAYPCKDAGRDVTFSEYFKEQNSNSTLNPLHGVTTDILWDRVVDFMINSYTTKKMVEEMKAEFEAYPIPDEKANKKDVHPSLAAIFGTTITDEAEIAGAKTLVDGIENVKVSTFYPRAEFSEAYNRLYQYWLDVRAGIDPNAEKTENSLQASAETKAALNADIKKIEDEAKAAAIEFCKNAAVAAESLWNESLECDTLAEFEAFIERVKKIKSGKDLTDADKELYDLLYNSTLENGFYGILYTPSGPDNYARLYPSTLTDALKAWYQDFLNGRDKDGYWLD